MAPAATKSYMTPGTSGIVTITPEQGTTTIFVTATSPTTSPTTQPHHGLSASTQKAVIAGSVAGGFVGFGAILGVLLWYFHFRQQPSDSRGRSGSHSGGFVVAGGRKKDKSTAAITTTGTHLPVPTSDPESPGDEKGNDRPNPTPLQPNTSLSPLPESIPLPTIPTRPTAKRTITSTSIDSENQSQPRRIPVVIPSFAYQDSASSGSSGSRLVNALKRSSVVASSAMNPSSSSRGSSNTRGGTPYQYGVVGSLDSRRASVGVDSFGLKTDAYYRNSLLSSEELVASETNLSKSVSRR